MSADCIFCRILAGDVPSTRVYEDADVLAFMDIGPVVKGHTLVIPKTHTEAIDGAPPALLEKLIVAVQKIARAQLRGLRADGVNVTQANGRIAGQVVPHLHFHVIPRFAKDDHSWHWPQRKYADSAEMERFAREIRRALGSEANGTGREADATSEL